MPAVYIAYNLGREKWCVLTADLHTVVHLLRDSNITTSAFSVGMTRCTRRCESHCFDLVPRLTPSFGVLIHGPWWGLLYPSYPLHEFLEILNNNALMKSILYHGIQHGFSVFHYLYEHDMEIGRCTMVGLDFKK